MEAVESGGSGKPRREAYIASGFDLSAAAVGIEAGDGAYLIEAIERLGWIEQSGMSIEPLRWTEIKAYADLTGDIAKRWEFNLIRDMSVAFIRGYKSEETFEPARWSEYQGLIRPLVMMKGEEWIEDAD